MTEPKRYTRGKHTYIHWGKFKEVRVQGKSKERKSPPPTQETISLDLDGQTAMGVYSNFPMVHRSNDELILDFVFLPPGQRKGRIRSRVILPLQQAKKLSQVLEKAANEIKQQESKGGR